MDIETYLTETIEKAVRKVIREELEAFKEEISNTVTTRPKNRKVSSKSSQPVSRIIRPKELANMLSLSIPTLYRIYNDGDLPPKVKISSRAVGWLRSDIEDWLVSRKLDE